MLSSKSADLASRHQFIPAGSRSLLITPKNLKVGEYVWNEDGVPPGALVIWVDLQRQLASVFRGGHEIGISAILYGGDDHPTPMGQFSVKKKDGAYHSRTYDAPMPFAIFITDDGVAIHGSVMGIGQATHGCIGVPAAFAQLLFRTSEVGDQVTILRTNQESASALSQRYLES